MKPNYILVTSTDIVEQFEKSLEQTDTVSFDLETTGLDCFVDRLRLIQFEVNEDVYIVNVEDSGKAKSYFFTMISRLEESGKTVIGHNIKFDIKFVYRETGILLTHVWDTQVAQMVLTAGKYPRQKFFALKELAEMYCDVELDKEIRMEFVYSDTITEEMINYAVRDVKFLRTIYDYQLGEARNLKMESVMDLEMKLVPVVTMMEYDGVLLDWDAWMALATKAKERAEELKPQIVSNLIDRSWEYIKDAITDGCDAYTFYDMPLPKARNSKTGKTDLTLLESLTNPTFIKKQLKNEFNISSHAQLKKALQLCRFVVDGILIQNTQAGTLEQLADDELIAQLLEWKEVEKRHTTYGESWQAHIHPVTGRVHPQFNQVGTVTGRWSSDSPNMQNVPKISEYRACFIARPGYKLATSDYSQAELRFVGAVSGEEAIIEAYKNGEDIHAKTASIVFEKPIEEVTSQERSRGKTLNFSILYGSTAFGVAQKNPDISEAEAEILLTKFFNGYPKLAQYIKSTSTQIWQDRMSRTPMGRIRFFTIDEDRLFADNELRRQMGAVKREGFNHIIQGGSADSLKIAMVYAFYNKPFEHDHFRFQLQVHDEVVTEIKEDILVEGEGFLINSMNKAEQLFLGDIPAESDCLIGDYWRKE